MSDIRSRLTEALDQTLDKWSTGRSEDIADVLLSLPGIAIVDAEDLLIVLRNAGYRGIAGSYGEWVTAHHRVTAAAVQAQEDDE